ncbi:pentapeptide repeat-containing protein [Corynebacterium ciconiae]|uniref:pentapeptide repeat-containing protein n=1 Tax=Corynebacterium ciconiae TaxID=227319 RepID=UPI00058F6418|nr:pentapeptide repeat-containing protein [Corynebacterium ciconiae]
MTRTDDIQQHSSLLTRTRSPIEALAHMLSEVNGAHSPGGEAIQNALRHLDCDEDGRLTNVRTVIALLEPLTEEKRTPRSLLGEELLQATISILASASSLPADSALNHVLTSLITHDAHYEFFRAIAGQDFDSERRDNDPLTCLTPAELEQAIQNSPGAISPPCVFSDTTIEGLDFSDASVLRGRFQNVVFSHCCFHNSRFINCDLDGVSFHHCHGENFAILTPKNNITRFIDCDFSFATTLIDGRLLREIIGSAVRGMDLRGHSSHLDLRIEESTLEGKLTDVTISARASQTQFSGADISRCELANFQALGVNVERSQLKDDYHSVIIPDWPAAKPKLIHACEEHMRKAGRMDQAFASLLLQLIEEDAEHSSGHARGSRFAAELLPSASGHPSPYRAMYSAAGVFSPA